MAQFSCLIPVDLYALKKLFYVSVRKEFNL